VGGNHWFQWIAVAGIGGIMGDSRVSTIAMAVVVQSAGYISWWWWVGVRG